MEETTAERLLLLAREVLYPKQHLIQPHAAMDDALIARVRMAIEFYRADKGLQLRAIVEDWSYMQIVREMY